MHDKLIEIITTSTFYLSKEKKWKWHDILLFQLFGPVLFSAHVYGSFAAADARILEHDYHDMTQMRLHKGFLPIVLAIVAGAARADGLLGWP